MSIIPKTPNINPARTLARGDIVPLEKLYRLERLPDRKTKVTRIQKFANRLVSMLNISISSKAPCWRMNVIRGNGINPF
jgi:hypothetical protein